MPGCVVERDEVAGRVADGDTAEVRATIGPATGSPDLEQRLIRFAPGASAPRGPGPEREEALFVLGGDAVVTVGEDSQPAPPETAVYVAAGESYRVESRGPGDVEVLSVIAPRAAGDEGLGPRRVAIGLAEQEARDATTSRQFRCLVDPAIGCPSLTQFVGYIPTERAPVHYHHYDEVVYILDGRGTVHIGELDAPMGAGTCIHLPPRQPHCLENTGAEAMRVLGVFRPAGDPSAAYEV